MSICENYLTQDFYDNFMINIGRGCYDYFFPVSEEKICTAIKESEWNLFPYIENPSKKVIQIAVEKDYNNLKNYDHLFNENELIDMINKSPFVIEHISKQYQTLKMCKIAITNIHLNHNDHYSATGTFIMYIAHFDDEIVDMIVDTHSIASGLHHVPNTFITKDRFVKALKSNSEIVQYLSYFPREWIVITNDMIKNMRNIQNLYSYIIAYVDNNDKKMLFDKMFMAHPYTIKDIPAEYQNIVMCKKAIEYDFTLLEYCHHINNDMIKYIFKLESRIHLPKKVRFDFINGFNEDALIRLIKVDGILMTNLDEEKLTDKLIRAALASNGYNLQYVHKQTQEYIDIALNNQPNAKKYIKSNVTN